MIRLLFLLCFLGAGIAYRCPGPDWHPRENTDDCYYVDRPDFDPSGKSWDDASNECKVRGGNLADSSSRADLDYMVSRLHNPPNLGLLSVNKIYYWLDLSFASGQWKWETSGKIFTVGDLGTYNPNSDSYFTSAATSARLKMRVAIIHDENDSKFIGIPQPGGLFGTTAPKGNFICKAAYSSRPLCRSEEGWDYINGRCWMFHRQMSTWDQAQQICFAEGGYIGVPNSDEENTRISIWGRNINRNEAWLGVKLTKDFNTRPETVFWEDKSSMLAHPYNQWPNTDIGAYLNGLMDGSKYCGVHQRALLATQQSKWSLERSCETPRPYACERDTEKCPYGWEHFDGHCYSVRGSDDDVVGYGTATLNCIGTGGHLAVITGSNVQSFLVQHFRRMGGASTSMQYFYIGLSANINTGFTWTNNLDALTSSYFNWAPGQPLATNVRRCAYMQMTQTNGEWAVTTDCMDPMGYVCQAKVGDANVTEYVRPETKCEAPFDKYHGTCFFYSGKPDVNRQASWADAAAYCRTMNASLAEITSSGENNFIRSYLGPARAWIGYQRQPRETGDPIVKFSDGRIVPGTAYTNYRTTINFENKYCYAMLHEDHDTLGLLNTWGKWDIEACEDQNYFVCTRRGAASFIPTRPVTDLYSPECGADWVYTGGHCYKINVEKAPYAYASQMCRTQDPTANLLYIRDDNENNVIKDLINERTNFSIPGLSGAETFWTSLQVTNKNQWSWEYRREHMWYLPMAFTNWAFNQPNPNLQYSTITPKCGFLKRDAAAQWESSDCDSYRPYICKKRPVHQQNTTVTTTPTAPVTPLGMNFTMGCKPGWQRSGDHCYHHSRNQTDWYTAFQTCRTFGSKFRLAELHNQANYDEVGAFLNGGWIGLDSNEKQADPRQFIYLHRRDTPNYTPWESQLPRPSISRENCVAMSGKGIVAYNCNEIKSYSCMTEVTPVELDPNECLKPPQDRGCRRWGYGRHDKCYYMGNDASHFGTRELVTFQQAREFCQTNFGGDLAVVNSAEAQEFMTFLIGSWGSDYWIGLREDSNPWESFKKWITGEDVTYTNWAMNEPHFQQQLTGCVAMHSLRTDTAMAGDWYVSQCDVPKFAMCEAPREGFTPPTPRPTQHFATGCPRGWSAPNNTEAKHCYYAWAPPDQIPNAPVDPTKLTWEEAEQSCNAFGGHLASIATEYEYRHVLDKVIPNRANAYSYWIGLQEDGRGDFVWSDGTPFGTFAFFHPNYNQHNDIMTADCVSMDGFEGKWYVQSCLIAKGWVCEIPRGWYNETDDIMQVTIPAPTITNANCPSGSSDDGDWYYHAPSSKCFFVSRIKNSWDNAHMSCTGKGANLASVTRTQQPFLMTLLTRYAVHDNLFWIGLRQTNPTTKQHRWVDNSQDLYRNWDMGEPHTEGIEACGAIANINGKWRDANCQRQYNYICLQSSIVVQPPTLPPVQADWGCMNCPDCVMFRDYCYFISKTDERRSWKDAEQACHNRYFENERGYQLTSVHDQYEQDFLSTFMMKDEIDRWGGLYQDPSRALEFFWSDQSPIDYTNWVPGEPNYHPDGPVCLEIKGPKGQAGKWNDDLCDVQKGYICKGRRFAGSPKPITSSTQGTCPDGYTQVGDACFVVRQVNGNRDTAHSVCTSADSGSRIASVMNTVEGMHIHLLLGEKENYPSDTGAARAWLGLTYENGKLQYRESNCYASFNNIQDFYAHSGRERQCVYMAWNGRWRLNDCTGANATLKYTVCERRLTPCQTVPPQLNGHCPTGFPNECNQYCLSFNYNTAHAPNQASKKSFQEARQDCVNRNGSLVSIRSQEDQQCLMKYMTDATESLWIGLYEQYDIGTNSYNWQWIDETVSLGTYQNWGPGEPNIFNPREDCTEILTNGFWNNIPCMDWWQTKRGHICEAPKIGDATVAPITITTTQPTIPTTTRPGTVGSSTTRPTATTSRATPPATVPTATTRQTQGPPGTGTSTATPQAGGSSTTREEGGTQPTGPTVYSGGIGAGGLAGIGVTIAILVPVLTIVGYIFWKRRNVGYIDKSQPSFKRGMAVDEEPVIDPDQAYDSYT